MLKLIAMASVMTVVVFLAPASRALAYTPQQQAACQDDAFRLCGHAVPDEQRVKACLIANMRRLSPSCRRIFSRRRR